jgi:hypothetical protein
MGIAAALLLTPAVAAAVTLDVCPTCRYTQIAPAVAAAHAGDTINVAGGTYTGGITIGKSVSLVGAGSGATIIRGGGPVLTIGDSAATREPTVSISAITITGGVVHSSQISATDAPVTT